MIISDVFRGTLSIDRDAKCHYKWFVLLSFGCTKRKFDVVADNESTRYPQRTKKIRVAERFSQMFSLTIRTEGMQAHKELFAQVF